MTKTTTGDKDENSDDEIAVSSHEQHPKDNNETANDRFRMMTTRRSGKDNNDEIDNDKGEDERKQ